MAREAVYTLAVLTLAMGLSTYPSVALNVLQDMLNGLKFRNKGVVTSSDVYTWKVQKCSYLELENITFIDSSWVVRGKFNYLFKKQSDGTLVVPPIGMRSAVPLGGISTGVTELRANGVFHEWTIQNQSPAGGAKITSLPDLLFGVRTSSSAGYQSFVLQTHPQQDILGAVPGVQSIQYSGSYPVAKLQYVDPKLPVNLTLHAYSTYRVGDMKSSAVPSIAFSFTVTNPTTETLNVSLMMNLPAVHHRTARIMDPVTQKKANVSATQNVTSWTECFQTCVENKVTKNCLTWSFDKQTGICSLYEDPQLNLNTFDDNAHSGHSGSWNMLSNKACLNYHIDDKPVGPSGDIATCIIYSEDVSTSFTTSNSTYDIFKVFTQQGYFPNTGFPSKGLYGASSLMIKNLAPNQSKTVTFLLPWYYPNRDFLGKTFGNQYKNFFQSIDDVVNYMDTRLIYVVQDISMMHSVFTTSSMDTFLQDIFINSLSHIRSAMWFADSRWRQWEANDCVNIDSVHNDGERHIPYIMFFPDSTRNKMIAWAKFQKPNGMIQEQLREGCYFFFDTRPIIDLPGGRNMSDVSSMFIVYALELYRWANDLTTVKTLWPNIKLAAQWHLNISTQYGVPEHLVNTYDVVGQNVYDLCSYNSVFHLLAMAAARELAIVMGDTEFAQQCQNAYSRGQDTLDKMQWNETAGYYNSYTDIANPHNPGALFSDTFYGQVLAYSLGLGLLIKNESRLVSHNIQTLLKNDSPYGLLVQTGRYPYPGPDQDNAVWQMANPNWATLSLWTKQDLNMAMPVAKRTLNRWRQDVNDLWNVAGVSGGLGYGAEGQPYLTAHYGYFMSSWHMIMALSGQQANLPQGLLTFNPPDVGQVWSYPLMLPGVLGTVSQNSTYYQVEIFFGNVTIGKELSVKGVDCGGPYPLTLEANQVKKWSVK